MTEAERVDAIYDLSAAWKFAGEIFPYFEEKEIDWDGAYQTYLGRVLCVESEREFHLLMAEFLNLLGDGHTDYRFPAKLADEAGYLPFTLMHLGGEWFIKEVLAGQEAFLAAKVLSVNGVGMEEFLKDCFRYIYHVENFADWWKLKGIMPFLLKMRGNELGTSKGVMRFDLERNAPTELIGIWQDVPSEKPVTRVYEGNGQKVLYVRMDNFVYPMVEREVLAALLQNPKASEGDSAFQGANPETAGEHSVFQGANPAEAEEDSAFQGVNAAEADVSWAENVGKDSHIRTPYTGVILDIRNNIGGMTAYAAGVAKLFLSGEFSACQKKTRMMKGIDVSSASQYEKMKEKQIESCIQNGLCTKEEVERCLRTANNKNYYEYKDSFGALGQRAVFYGPVILLTGRGTISAAEDFTAMFKSTKRAALMGEATFGSTGTPLLKRLRLGGSMRICSVGYRLLDGTKFIGKGIEPDIFAEGNMEAYESGKDVVLEQALKRLGIAV